VLTTPSVTIPRALLFISLLAGAVLRIHLALTDDGMYWPDEIYQSLEPAHRLVFGHGLIAWEFIEGARNWALPGVVAAVMKVSTLLGDSSSIYLLWVKLVFVFSSLVAALGARKLALTFAANELTGSIAATLFSFASLAIYFSPRAMAENACSAPLIWGLGFVFQKDVSKSKLILGASLLGLATLFRLQCALVCVVVVVIFFLQALFKKRPWKSLGITLGILCIWGFLYGALDAFTWSTAPGALYGGWFHSAIVYLKFNLIENRAAQWGTASFDYYVKHLFSSMPAISVAMAIGFVLSVRRAWSLVLVIAVFLLLHFKTPHKELRFIIPMLPLLCSCVAIGLNVFPTKVKWMLGIVCIAIAMQSAFVHKKLTMGDIGSYTERAGSSAYDDYGHVIRLMKIAGQNPQVCGLRVDVAHPAWTGGYSAIHRNIGFYFSGTPGDYNWFNAVITFAGSGYPVIASDTGLELVKLPNDTCAPNPNYSWRLP
jgi:GPI mannosyltransferase 3